MVILKSSLLKLLRSVLVVTLKSSFPKLLRRLPSGYIEVITSKAISKGA